MNRLENKVAVVTGAGRGIGKAIAKRFAQEGAQVAVISRNPASCGAAAEAINAEFSGKAQAFACDVSDSTAVKNLAKELTAAYPEIHILVNNAGITRDGLMMRMSEEDWDAVLNTNLKSAFLTTQTLMRPLMKSGAGRVINVASVIGLVGNAGQANYAASKAGLIGLTKSLARELASRQVTANVIAPGFIKTDMTDELSEEQQQAALSGVPLKTMGEVSDIAAAAAYLASEEGRYITGQTFCIDGGMVMS